MRYAPHVGDIKSEKPNLKDAKENKLNKPFSRISAHHSNQTSVLLEKRSQSHAKRKESCRQAPVMPF